MIDRRNGAARKEYGSQAAWTGVVVNLQLGLLKLLAGLTAASLALVADSINTLTDSGSSVLTLVSFKISAKAPDKNHPFGHARYEYVLSSILAVIIMFVGGQLLWESILKILSPSEILIKTATIIVLIISTMVKIGLFVYYRYLGKKINSIILEASSKDSLSDALASLVILVSMILFQLIEMNLDGYIGVIVALIIIKNGFDILMGGINLIVGKQVDLAEEGKIKCWIFAHDGVLGVHDLIVHDYGPEQRFISVHIEVDSRLELIEAHDIVETMENDAVKEYGWQLVAHIDPIDVSDPELHTLRQLTERAVQMVDTQLSIHDFRILRGKRRFNLIFDCDVPNELDISDGKLKEQISQAIHKLDTTDRQYELTITFDRNYVRSSAK